MESLKRKTVLVMGQFGGLDETIGRKFHQEGAWVIFAGENNVIGKKVMKEWGERYTFLYLDFKNEQDWKQINERIILDFGGLDILINTSLFSKTHQEIDASDSKKELKVWNEKMVDSLVSIIWACQYGIPLMKRKNGGVILNIYPSLKELTDSKMIREAFIQSGIRLYAEAVAQWCLENNSSIRCHSFQNRDFLSFEVLSNAILHLVISDAKHEIDKDFVAAGGMIIQ